MRSSERPRPIERTLRVRDVRHGHAVTTLDLLQQWKDAFPPVPKGKTRVTTVMTVFNHDNATRTVKARKTFLDPAMGPHNWRDQGTTSGNAELFPRYVAVPEGFGPAIFGIFRTGDMLEHRLTQNVAIDPPRFYVAWVDYA